jgi:hypothetical protein
VSNLEVFDPVVIGSEYWILPKKALNFLFAY